MKKKVLLNFLVQYIKRGRLIVYLKYNIDVRCTKNKYEVTVTACKILKYN